MEMFDREWSAGIQAVEGIHIVMILNDMESTSSRWNELFLLLSSFQHYFSGSFEAVAVALLCPLFLPDFLLCNIRTGPILSFHSLNSHLAASQSIHFSKTSISLLLQSTKNEVLNCRCEPCACRLRLRLRLLRQARLLGSRRLTWSSSLHYRHHRDNHLSRRDAL